MNVNNEDEDIKHKYCGCNNLDSKNNEKIYEESLVTHDFHIKLTIQ